MAVLVMMATVVGMRGQNFSGIWYIANNTNHNSTTDQRWYMVPAKDPQQPNAIDAYYSPNHNTTPGDSEKPFLTTYQTNKDSNSIWIIAPSGVEGNYYIIHAITGKYVIYEPPLPNDSDNQRKSMHLQTIDNSTYNPGTNNNFTFKVTGTSTSSPINIQPQSRSDWYFNPAGSNKSTYYGQDSPLYRNGIIGIYNSSGGDSWWFLEDAKLPAPTIHIDDEAGTYTFSYPNNILPDGYSFLFTTNGNDPTVDGTGVTTWDATPQSIVGDCHIKAVIARYGVVLSEVAEQIVDMPDPPTITYDNTTGNVTISSATTDASIYYTTDGSTTPTSSSTLYSAPFSITGETTIKAIAVKGGFRNSEVATVTISKLAAPTVTFNDANQTVSITKNSDVEGATTYYTDDSTDPTAASTEYTSPISLTATTTIKARNIKDGYINSDVTSLTVTKLASLPTITISGNSATLSYAGDSDATIHYTTDGTTPTSESSTYTTAISLSGDQKYTIKAIATKAEYLHSDVATEVVDKRTSIPAPTITVDGNSVTITANDAGDEIYYTTDETEPTTSTLTHFTGTGTFNLVDGSNYTVKAIASNGTLSSSVVTQTVDLSDLGYSGIYYIQSSNREYYMYPVGGESTYVKTAKNADKNAIWKIEKVGDYYRIIHYEDGKYLVAADATVETNTVSLVETNSPDETALFEITRKSGSETNLLDQIILFRPKAAANDNGHIYLNTTQGNDGTHTIGLYDNTGSSEWRLGRVPAKPTLTVADLKVTMTNTLGDIYYTTDGADPTTSSTNGKSVMLAYGPSYTVKAISVYTDPKSGGTWQSDIASKTVKVDVLAPTFSVSGNTVYLRSSQAGVEFRYTTDGGISLTPTTGESYDNNTGITLASGNVYTLKALAYNTVSGTVYPSVVSTIEVDLREATEISSLTEITSATGNYKLTANNTYSSSNKPAVTTFSGILDGGDFIISDLTAPLFETLDGGTVHNVTFDNIEISSGNTNGDAGAVCSEAKGTARIYNVGVLATGSTVDENGHVTTNSSTIGASRYVGGLVGLLDGSARVINCYSYADITGGDKVGGIVGYNNVATTATNLKTMVMNCMFYGDITGGTNKAPIYNGQIITNIDNNKGVSNFNFFCAEASYVQNLDIDTYNCALMAEKRFLQRFEFFRHLLNSNRELAAWWATGNMNKDQMMKWVMEPSQIGTAKPYPILKEPGRYHSVVNIDNLDVDNATSNSIGTKLATLTVHIQMGSGGAKFGAPTGAGIKSGKETLYLDITDKDPGHYNFNYYKVQLPYYNDVGTGNYTTASDGTSRVVAGWKIVNFHGGGTAGTFTTGSNDAPAYNFADRKCTNKDYYGTGGSNRIFNQGAYFDVPEGVSEITIEPYWAKCVYLSDATPDVVYKSDMTAAYNVTAVAGGQRYVDGSSYSINGVSQKVYTSMNTAVSALSTNSSYTPYDYAVVLVGNYHQYNGINTSDKQPYTVTSVDLDGDNEPDYSFILRFDGRTAFHPVRYDFLNLMGLGMAQKSTGGTGSYNFGIMQPKGWFEVTNTALFRVTQFEYSPSGRSKKPIILHGGVMEQWVSLQGNPGDCVEYFHVGGNVWFKEFHLGIHQDKNDKTPHPPVSVTGGDFDYFYLTGAYRADVEIYDDNAECYINGGRFGIMAGTGMEGLGTTSDNGNITWQIDNADITEFYGGGINAAHPAIGNISTTISNSRVTLFCGGPKFGDMIGGKTVTTNATNCTFGTYFGAGYGGNSYSREAPNNRDKTMNTDWNNWITTNYKQEYKSGFGGVSTQFDYQFLPMSGNANNVCRIFIEYVKFSLATTHNVISNLTGCTVTGNFYGGGNLGKVDGNVTSTLTNCTVNGDAFGAGFSASLPSVEVDSIGFRTEPYYYQNLGNYRIGVKGPTETYTWEHAETVNNTASAINKDDHILYTTENLTTLGTVTGTATLNIKGATTVEGSVYGGGCEADVMGNTRVEMEDGYIFNGIFGGGLSGSVGTFTRSTADADVTVFGHEAHEGCIGKPVSCAENTGKCTVVVTGGQIGPIEVTTKGMTRSVEEGGPVSEGWVWGAGCGLIEDPATHPDTHFKTYVNETEVTIGGDAFILESIIGGGEFGRVLGNTHVTIQDACQIGVGENQTETVNGVLKPKRYADEKFINPLETPVTNSNALVECSHFPYGRNVGTTESPNWVYETFDPYYDKYYVTGAYKDNIPEDFSLGSTSHASDGKTWIGCVFGGGSGYYPYEKSDGTGYGWLRSAGWVEGNSLVEIKGGHILTNVYGANEYTDVKGSSTVRMSGGTIGVPRTLEQIKESPNTGNLYGGGKGDPRTYFNTMTNVGSVEIEVTGGIIYGSLYGGGEDGHVLGNVVTTISKETGEGTSAPVIGCDGTSGDDGNVFGGGKGASTALTAGVVGGNVNLTILDGSIKGSVYGGGQVASVGTHFTAPYDDNYGKMQEGEEHGCITVNLKGGTIEQNVYGGCMGMLENAALGISKDVSVNLNKDVDDTARGCAVKGEIFGCNNVNSTPQGAVTVHIYKTQNAAADQIVNTAASGETPAVTNAKVSGRYDVKAVYGGGNLAAYEPTKATATTDDEKDQAYAHVIIEGCGSTSIQQVYGGGNAASTPATMVDVDGTFEIEEVFGGGNGKDDISKDAGKTYIKNPGANVGFKDYWDYEKDEDIEDYNTKAKRQSDTFLSNYVYGSGKARVNIHGGKVHRVYGGSNTKGNVRITAVTMLEDESGCDFDVDEAYGGGKSAPMDAESRLEMACIPGLKVAYGGAENAEIEGDVNLTITNGTFDRVFGGNNVSGYIKGTITVNIEETGCKPIIIGQLYGGGNQAPYTAPFKEGSTTEREDGPTINVRSFTSIGEVYGGGYGKTAVVTGDTHVNINVCEGKYKDGTYTYSDHSTIADKTGNQAIQFTEYARTDDGDFVEENGSRKVETITEHLYLPLHDANKIGAINRVFGGGNAAKVDGDTYVYIGTKSNEVFKTPVTKTVKVNNEDQEVNTTDEDRTQEVKGADIRDNVYGGGNKAEVTGKTNVTIGKEKE